MKKIIKNLETSVIALLMLTLMFVIIEPAIGSAASATSQMTETLNIDSEISFLTPASNIVLSPNLPGMTGNATANGQTQVRVLTNASAGYTMTITASSSLGMIGNATGAVIPAYTPTVSNVPDFTFAAPVGKARFGYTVEASTTNDLAQAFKDNGANCNTGSGSTVNACWLNASTSAFTIINRSSYTPDSGATTTIKFRVMINGTPSPMIIQDTYVATTTLTATTNS